jgi:hypothetical protein
MRAPLSWLWLAILFVTTRVQRRAGRRGARRLQREHSTNLRRLRKEPWRVLVTSLFWLDVPTWWPHIPVFVAFVAPAERRLGSARWLRTGVAAHVVGTYVGQGFLGWSIRHDKAPRRLANARDVGVSYFVFGVSGGLSAYIEPPWRAPVRLATLVTLIANVLLRPTFSEVGHLTAFLVGLAVNPRNPDASPYPALPGGS